MTLLIILCALVITRWSSLLYAIRTDGRLFVYVESLIPRLGGNPYLAMGIVLLFSIGLILMLQSILMSFAFGFLAAIPTSNNKVRHRATFKSFLNYFFVNFTCFFEESR